MDNVSQNEVNVEENAWHADPCLKRFGGKEIKSANRERDELLESLSGRADYSFMGSKIHLGKLSPGCLICGNGYWSCMFINGLCTANCFYCPQDRKIKDERAPKIDADIYFDDPEEYVSYIERFNFKGVGFSGGETLLVFGKLLSYIEKIRERFGKSLYLWIYTNGSLLDRDKLIKLKKSGVDEIRFNISVNNYELRQVELAAGIMDTVTVEIPGIPEDYEAVKKCLKGMRKIGVKYLNMHQLLTTQYNYKNYIKRGYTFLNSPDLSIFESEIMALRLMRYAVDNDIGMNINYCSTAYKNRFQNKGARERCAYLIKKSFEGLTGSGHIRVLSIHDSSENIDKIVNILLKDSVRPELWSLNNAKTDIFIHEALLRHIDFNKYSLIISYFYPILKASLTSGEESEKEIKLRPDKTVFLKKELTAQQELSNKVTIGAFQKIFIENMDWGAAMDYFYRNYKLKTRGDSDELKKDTERLLALREWENVKPGFGEVC